MHYCEVDFPRKWHIECQQHTDGQQDGQTDGQIDGQADEQADGKSGPEEEQSLPEEQPQIADNTETVDDGKAE